MTERDLMKNAKKALIFGGLTAVSLTALLFIVGIVFEVGVLGLAGAALFAIIGTVSAKVSNNYAKTYAQKKVHDSVVGLSDEDKEIVKTLAKNNVSSRDISEIYNLELSDEDLETIDKVYENKKVLSALNILADKKMLEKDFRLLRTVDNREQVKSAVSCINTYDGFEKMDIMTDAVMSDKPFDIAGTLFVNRELDKAATKKKIRRCLHIK